MNLVFDIEVARDYFLVGFKSIETGTVRQYEYPLDKAQIVSILRSNTLIGFNSTDYDLPVLFYALTGATLEQIKHLSDTIITHSMRSWQTEQAYGFKIPELDHIDLKEPVPGVQISLKLYAARLHSKRIQDLPYDPDAYVKPMRDTIRAYNVNDLDCTIDLWREATKDGNNIIETRKDIGAEFGIDVRSKSDAQIAEACIKIAVSKLKGQPIYKSDFQPGATFKYTPPAFIQFRSKALNTILASIVESVFVIDNKGAVVLPPALSNATVTIGQTTHRMGIGGLHSTESTVARIGNLFDRDVVSYYPSLILLCGLSPANMGDAFQAVYRRFYNSRLEYKRLKNTSKALTYKITLNGAYGKLGSPYSVLYAPHLMIQVTLTGQLALLMLIERMEDAGIPIVSSNTDGIVMQCPPSHESIMQSIVQQWEKDTGLETEETRYRALYSRDVNTYLAIKTDGKVKVKGALAPSDAQHNPSNEIVKQAVIAFLSKGTPIAQTILSCTDIRQFLTVQRVTGGAQIPTKREYVDTWVNTAKGLWTLTHNGTTHKEKRVSRPAPLLLTTEARYLGKVVRWYISRNATGYIERVSNGNKVPCSDNAVPMMELGDFPDDIDHDYYIREATGLLKDIGAIQA